MPVSKTRYVAHLSAMLPRAPRHLGPPPTVRPDSEHGRKRHTMTALTLEDRIERAIDKSLPHMRRDTAHGRELALRVLDRAAKRIEAAK